MTTQTSMRKTAGADDRSEATRATIKKYYIYVVLLLIVVDLQPGQVGRGRIVRPRAPSSARTASSTCCASPCPS